MLKREEWKVSIKVCRESLRKWKNDPRIWCVALLVCLFEWTKIEPIRDFCREMELSISNWYFPFLFTDQINAMFFFFGILILFCDAPFVDRQQMFVIIRSGKKNWFRGKILYVFVASFLYFTWMYVVSLLEFFPYIGFSTKWEMILEELSKNGWNYGVQGIHPIPEIVVDSLTPIKAWFISYVVCLLLAVFLGLLIFVLNLNQNHNIGVGAALAIILLDGFGSAFSIKTQNVLRFFSPVSWADIELFASKEANVPIWYAIGFLCLGITLWVALIMRKARDYNIEAMEEL